jgi:hypothetical protein
MPAKSTRQTNRGATTIQKIVRRRQATNKTQRKRNKRYKSRNVRRMSKSRGPNNFAVDLIHLAFPHDGSPAIRYPDGQGVETMAMNVTTTGIIRNNGTQAPIVSGAQTQYFPPNERGIFFYPGSMHHMSYLSVLNNTITQLSTLPVVPVPYVVYDLGFPAPNSLIVNNVSTSISQFRSYRVTGATLKLTYIGNPDDSGGEITVVKFDPSTINPLLCTGNERTVPIMPDEVMHARSERFTAHKGCYISFHKSHLDNYSNFKDILEAQNNSALEQSGAAVQAAQSSLEAVAIFFRGTKPANNTESLAAWRWELVQTIEFIPDVANFTARLATEAPHNLPLFHHAYDEMYKMLKDKSLDIVSEPESAFVRNSAYQCALQSAARAAAKNGAQIPRIGVESIGLK